MDANEILDAVAVAIADLRKEHAAEIAALRESFEVELREHVAAVVAPFATAEELGVVVDTVRELVHGQAKALGHIENKVYERATSIDLADAIAPILERVNEHGAALAALATKDALVLLEAKLSDHEAALIDHAADIRASVSKGDLDDALNDRAATLALAIRACATPEQITEAVQAVADMATTRMDGLTLGLRAVTQHLADVEGPFEECQRAVEALQRAQMSEDPRIVAIQSALPILQAAVAAQEGVLATKANLEHVADLEAAQSALEAALEDRPTQADMHAVAQGVTKALADRLLERYQGAAPWDRGGPAYQPFALVKHRGALWQSTTRTSEEPAPGSRCWMLLSDVPEAVEFTRAEPGYLTLSTRYLSGAETTVRLREPIPVFRGVYSTATKYQAWDTVAKDSHVFLCLVDAPTAGPGEVLGEWQVFSGPRGRKGRDAEVDEKALADRVLREVIPQLQQAVDQMEAQR